MLRLLARPPPNCMPVANPCLSSHLAPGDGSRVGETPHGMLAPRLGPPRAFAISPRYKWRGRPGRGRAMGIVGRALRSRAGVVVPDNLGRACPLPKHRRPFDADATDARR